MNICRHCKKATTNLFVDSRNFYNTAYYSCVPCNTLRIKRYRHTKRGKIVYREIMKKQYKKHKEKVLARGIVYRAIKTKLIIKPTECSSCNMEKILEGHHENYSKPLDVVWLCRDCHIANHPKM